MLNKEAIVYWYIKLVLYIEMVKSGTELSELSVVFTNRLLANFGVSFGCSNDFFAACQSLLFFAGVYTLMGCLRPNIPAERLAITHIVRSLRIGLSL